MDEGPGPETDMIPSLFRSSLAGYGVNGPLVPSLPLSPESNFGANRSTFTFPSTLTRSSNLNRPTAGESLVQKASSDHD